ncbi:DNA repair protein RadA [Patescibacteria group bacterium]|nr:DNA repair protein RadA [Patescibacteria group bacterium]
MARDKMFVCNNCGNEYSRWMGKCEACAEWNTLKEVSKKDIDVIQDIESSAEGYKAGELSKLSDGDFEGKRLKSSFDEWELVLGGGVVEGSVTLFGGEPGVGKSTLILQVCNDLVNKGYKILYVSGEESLAQVGGRAKRMGVAGEKIDFLDSVYWEQIEKIVEEGDYNLVVIDSVQTLMSSKLSGGLGSMVQLRYCVARLTQYLKKKNIAAILVGHVTKEGEVAGPKILEHMVDVVLMLEGERSGDLRVLRSRKNRFGSVDETGVFVMSQAGMKSVDQVSKMFLKERKIGIPGSAISVAMEGTRPYLVEIQSIADRTVYGTPKRTSVGLSLSRLSMLLAVLGKRAALDIYDKDVYLNVVGGFKLEDRSTDLGVITAIASVVLGRPVYEGAVMIGEVGLLGEVRRVKGIKKRVKEARNMGFDKIIVPQGSDVGEENIVEVGVVYELFEKLF